MGFAATMDYTMVWQGQGQEQGQLDMAPVPTLLGWAGSAEGPDSGRELVLEYIPVSVPAAAVAHHSSAVYQGHNHSTILAVFRRTELHHTWPPAPTHNELP